MDEDVRLLKDEDPNSFNYYLFYYMAGNYNIERESELKKAEKLDPTNPAPPVTTTFIKPPHPRLS